MGVNQDGFQFRFQFTLQRLIKYPRVMKTGQIQSERKYGNCASRLVSWFNDCAAATATISVKPLSDLSLHCHSATAFLTTRELFLVVAETILASHAERSQGFVTRSCPKKGVRRLVDLL